MHVVSHPAFASELVAHPCSNSYPNGPMLARRDGLGIRSVNEGCSGLAVLSGISPSNLAALFRNDTGIDGSVINRCSVLIRRPGRPSSANLLNCSEQGNAMLLWPLKLLFEFFLCAKIFLSLKHPLRGNKHVPTCLSSLLAVDIHRKIPWGNQLTTNEAPDRSWRKSRLFQ